MPYADEHSCRLLDPSDVEVVGSGERGHEGKRYRVIYGKPRGGDGSVEQAYRYPVDEWSESEARAHCEAHGGILFEPASRGAEAGLELRFWASVRSLGEGRLATFYLMDTGLNRNGWRVTDRALEEALPTLLGRPLGCIPGYGVDHAREPLGVGRWVGAEKPDGYALATAEITDPVAWGKIACGDWGPVSVVIRAHRVSCSACGGDVTGGPDGHLLAGEGHEVVEAFVFDRVDFVSQPAYPGAGLLTTGRVAGPGEAPGPISWSNLDGPQGARGDPKPEGKGRREQMEAEKAELRRELEALRAENTGLRARLAQVEAERHRGLVEAALEARSRAGLVRDGRAEQARLGGLDDGALALLREDAERVAEMAARAPPAGPKARYGAPGRGALEAAVDEARERLFGHRRAQ